MKRITESVSHLPASPVVPVPGPDGLCSQCGLPWPCLRCPDDLAPDDDRCVDDPEPDESARDP